MPSIYATTVLIVQLAISNLSSTKTITEMQINCNLCVTQMREAMRLKQI